jgi:hypothetical protein
MLELNTSRAVTVRNAEILLNIVTPQKSGKTLPQVLEFGICLRRF